MCEEGDRCEEDNGCKETDSREEDSRRATLAASKKIVESPVAPKWVTTALVETPSVPQMITADIDQPAADFSNCGPANPLREVERASWPQLKEDSPKFVT